jgi:hypothetical protein
MVHVGCTTGREHMKKYQVRPSEIATSAWDRGYLKPLELLRIAAWKTGQGLGSLTVNTEHDIESRTGESMDSIRNWKGRRVVGLTDQALWDDWRETAHRRIHRPECYASSCWHALRLSVVCDRAWAWILS